MLEIKIKYHDEELIRLEKFDKGDWHDLRSMERIEMKAGDFKLINLGVSMELPFGYEAHVVARSSTFKNFGIIQANSLGIIDNSYKGDTDIWRFPAIAMRDTVIEKNDRICQFRLVLNMPKTEFIEVESLGNKNRGGWGSSGIK